MAIGRGLESLIPSKKSGQEKTSKDESVFLIDIEVIKPNPGQPRREFDREALRELASSIREHGILQPLVVRKIEEETSSGTRITYELIAGERRLRAAKMAGLPRVPAMVRETISDGKSLEISVIENVQREDLNALERAIAFERLQKEFEMTQQEISERIGKSREVVANALRLLRLPKLIQEAILRDELSEGHARAILAHDDEDIQLKLYDRIKTQGMNVREAETAAREAKAGLRRTGAPIREADAERAELEQQIREALGSGEVRIVRQSGKEKGSISIRFLTKQQLRDIARKIVKS